MAPAVVEPEPTLGFDRVIQQAMMHAVSSSAKHVESGSLLVFLLQEEDSHAAYFLRSQGVERLLLLRVLSHGAKSENLRPLRLGGSRARRRRIRCRRMRRISWPGPRPGRSIRSSAGRSRSSA